MCSLSVLQDAIVKNIYCKEKCGDAKQNLPFVSDKIRWKFFSSWHKGFFAPTIDKPRI